MKVKFPVDYEKTYYRIRNNVREQQVIDETSTESSSLAYHIRNSRATFEAEVLLYDGAFFPKRQCTVKTRRGVSVPFIEPFVAYTARVETVKDNKWVQYNVTRIIKMHVIPFSLHATGVARFQFMCRQELAGTPLFVRRGLAPDACVRALRAAVHMRTRGQSRIVDDIVDVRKVLGAELFEEAQNRSLYYLLRELLDAKNLYGDCLQFDKLVMMRLTQPLIQELKIILVRRPWELALPSKWARFSLKPIRPPVLRCMEGLFIRLQEEGKIEMVEDEGSESALPEARRFPAVYYWISYLYHAVLKSQEKTKDMYTTYLGLYEAVRLLVWKDEMDTKSVTEEAKLEEIARDPVRMALHMARRMTDPEYGAAWFRDGAAPPEVLQALGMLCEDKSLVFVDEPAQDTNMGHQEAQIGEAYRRYVEGDEKGLQRVRTHGRYGAALLKREEDRVYGFTEGNESRPGKTQRIYDNRIWGLRCDLLAYLRLLYLRNKGRHSEIPAPRTDWDEDDNYDRLNEKQRDALQACVSDQPIAYVEGEPGSGKTEVIRAYCKALDVLGHGGIMIGGVNGITCNVLRKRLAPSFDVDRDARRGDAGQGAVAGEWTVQIACMTLDMMYALSKNPKAVGFQTLRADVHTLIIDEAQNVDIQRLTRVLGLFPSLTRLRIFGDFDQIQAICIGQALYDMRWMALEGIYRVTLEENNRVRKNPDSQSIVTNFRAMTSADRFDIDYALCDDDDGSRFLTLGEQGAIEEIVEMYATADDARTISIITPMRKSASRLNAKLGDRLREIVMSNQGWKEPARDAYVPFACKGYTIDGQRVKRFHLRVGCKIRFCKNYTSTYVKTSPPRATEVTTLRSDAVYNGECAFIRRVQKKRVRGRGNMWILHVVFRDKTRKRVVVGAQHVDVNDIEEGWATTIDAMLGGQNETMVLHLGRFYHVSATNEGALCPVMRNLQWVDRKRLVSAVSRAEKHSTVIAPRITMTRDMLEKLFEKRERDCGRIFDRHNAFTESSYTFGAKMILKIMASLVPRERASDVETYTCAVRKVVVTLPLDFLAPQQEGVMDVDVDVEPVVRDDAMDVERDNLF